MKFARLLLFVLVAASLFAAPVPVTVDPTTKAFAYPTAAQLRAANDLLAASTATTLYQPLSLDLTALSGQASTSFGRATLNLADAAAARSYFGAVIGTNVEAWSVNLDSWSLLAPSSKADTTALVAHLADLGNPHQVTKAQVGLGNVANVDTTNAANITSGTLLAARLYTSAAGYAIVGGTQLDALAALASSGLVARTASNTFAARTLTGTAGQVTVANGDGILGDPTVAISSALTGINSLTSAALSNLTLGTGTFGTALTFASATGAATFAGTVTATQVFSSSSSVIGPGGTAASDVQLQINGSSASGHGGYLNIARNGSSIGQIGPSSVVIGGTEAGSSNLAIYTPNGIEFWIGAGSIIQLPDTSGNILKIGTGAIVGQDTAIALTRTWNDASGLGAGSSGHGFEDASILTRTGGSAYAAFSVNTNLSGVADYNHLGGYQHTPIVNIGAHTLTTLFGFATRSTITSGTVTTSIGYWYQQGATATNLYAFKNDDGNASIYNQGDFRNYGLVGIGGANASGHKLDVIGGNIHLDANTYLLWGASNTERIYANAGDLELWTGGVMRVLVGDTGTTLAGTLTTNLGLQTKGAADSGGAGYAVVRVPN